MDSEKILENEFDKEFKFILNLGLDSQEDYDRIKAGWIRLHSHSCNIQNIELTLREYLET